MPFRQKPSKTELEPIAVKRMAKMGFSWGEIVGFQPPPLGFPNLDPNELSSEGSIHEFLFWRKGGGAGVRRGGIRGKLGIQMRDKWESKVLLQKPRQ